MRKNIQINQKLTACSVLFFLFLAACNSKVRLSSTGSKFIKAAAPMAADITLSNLPSASSNDSILKVDVTGPNVTSYKRILKSTGEACSAKDFETESWRNVTTSITDSLGADGAKRLCVLVRNAGGKSTDPALPKEYTWIKDSVAPVASDISLTRTPENPSNGSALNVLVAGVISYQYALTTNSTDCKNATYNGSWILINIPITNAIGADANKKRLCVIGRDDAGNVMNGSTDAAHMYDWLQDTVKPIAADITLAGMPADPSSGTGALNVTVGGVDVATYQYALTTSATACTAATYNGNWIPVATPITASIGADADKKRLCVIAKDFAGNEILGASDAAKSYDWKQDATKPVEADITLTGVPSDPSNATAALNITVGGTDISDYKYAYTTTATACTAATYSVSWIAVATYITDAVGADAVSQRLCVIARDFTGNEMVASTDAPKVAEWLQDTVKPVAADVTLTGTPTDPSNGTGNLSVTVSGASAGGSSVVAYQYSYATSGTACTAATYGSWIVVATAITDAIGSDANKKRLCVVTKDAAGNIQLTSAAKSYDWLQDTDAPSAAQITLTNAPKPISDATTLAITVGGTGVTAYRYKIATSDTCSTDTGYSASDIAVATNITDSISNTATYPFGGTIYLCVKGVDAAGNVTSAASAKIYSWIKELQPVSTLSPVLWLRADSGIVKDGSNKISKWADSSGNEHGAVQLTGSAQPTWTASNSNAGNKPTILFNGTSTALNNTTLSSLNNVTEMTAFYVLQSNETQNSVAAAGFNWQFAAQWASGSWFDRIEINSNAGVVNGSGTNFVIFDSSFNGAASGNSDRLSLFLNGANTSPTYTGTTLASTNSGNGYYIGNAGGNFFWDGSIAEVMVFNKVLSNSERQKIEGYLSVRYNINILPASDQNFWLRADKDLFQSADCTTTAATSHNDPVGCWKDQSGQNNHATQSTAGDKPLFSTSGVGGKASIDFVSNDLLTLPNMSSITELFAVTARPDAAPAVGLGHVFSQSNAINRKLAMHGANPFSLPGFYGDDASGRAALNFIDSRFSFEDGTVFVNGASYLDINSELRTNGKSIWGQHGLEVVSNMVTTLGASLDGYISEILGYSSELKSIDKQRVETYLAQKYGATYTTSPVLDAAGLQLWLKADAGITASNNAAQFVAANSEDLSRADNASLSMGSTDMSIATWVYLDSATQGGIAGKFQVGAGEYALTYHSVTNRFLFFVSPDGTSSTLAVSDNFGAPSLSRWYFVVGTYDSATQKIGISVNAGTPNLETYSAGIFDGASPFTIGQYNGNYLTGRIAKVGLWKKALTSEERTQLYNDGHGLTYTGLDAGLRTSLQSYWNLDEASGTRNDSHGTNHLTDNNTVTQATGPGSSVGTWVDQSGNNLDVTQSVVAGKPNWIANGGTAFYSKPVLRFDGVNSTISRNGLGTSSNWTMFSVAKINSGAAGSPNVWFAQGPSDYMLLGAWSGLFVSGFTDGATGTNPATSSAISYSPTILTQSVVAGSKLKHRINGGGLLETNITATELAFTSVLHIGSQGGGAYYWDGDIAELIFYKSDVPTLQRQAIECYLGAKYNIAISGFACP